MTTLDRTLGQIGYETYCTLYGMDHNWDALDTFAKSAWETIATRIVENCGG